MEIKKVISDKKEFLELLLLADEQEGYGRPVFGTWRYVRSV